MSLGEHALRMAKEALRVSQESTCSVRRLKRSINFITKRDRLYYASIGFQHGNKRESDLLDLDDH